MRKRECSRYTQLEFGAGFVRRPTGGGRPRSKDSGVPHLVREKVTRHTPGHVTARLMRGLPDLRNVPTLHVLWGALDAACMRAGRRVGALFRITGFSVQGNHVHLLVEAEDSDAMARGLNGLFVRMARALNRHWGRKGKVFAERYHLHVLRWPREVRNALKYVLWNAVKHGRAIWKGMPDPFGSGQFFDGWREVPEEAELIRPKRGPVAPATSWLRRVGWRRCGLIPIWTG